MEIRFGRPIVSIDGERVGLVDSLILDSECRYVRQIRILHGIDERSVPYHAVASVNEDGILDLTLTAFEVQQTSRQHSESADRFDRSTMPFTTWVTGETLAPSFTPGVQPNPPYRPAEVADDDPDEIQIDGEIVVTGPDGKVIGTIAGVDADETGRIQELIIDTGFLRPDLRVDMDSVEYLEGSYVSRIL